MTSPTNTMWDNRDAVARLCSTDFVSNGDHPRTKFVPEDHSPKSRWNEDRASEVLVEVRATDPGPANLDENVLAAGIWRLR
jgi:hypothetical protein